VNPFFVGWAGLPRGLYGFIAAVVAGLIGLGAVFAVLILVALPPRVTGEWSGGDFTGILVTKPYPLVRVPGSGNAPPRSILLVDAWKFGLSLGPEFHESQSVHVQGYALQRGDVTVLQASAPPQPASAMASLPALHDAGAATLTGEIVDSKCWSGAMNPGNGKAHRGCGSLCLLGGIPALFITAAPDGAVRWYLLADADGNALDEAIRLHVGERLTLAGRVLEAADLHEFRVDRQSGERLLALAADQPRQP
jgi:hypothetical protein